MIVIYQMVRETVRMQFVGQPHLTMGRSFKGAALRAARIQAALGRGAPLGELVDEVHAALCAVEGALGLCVARSQLAHSGRHRVTDHAGHAPELQHDVLHTQTADRLHAMSCATEPPSTDASTCPAQQAVEKNVSTSLLQ